MATFDAGDLERWRGVERYLLVRYPERDEQQGQIRRYGSNWLLWSTRNWIAGGLACDAGVLDFLEASGIEHLYYYVLADRGYYLTPVAEFRRLGTRRRYAGREQVVLDRRHWRKSLSLFQSWLASPRTQIVKIGERQDLGPAVLQPGLFGR